LLVPLIVTASSIAFVSGIADAGLVAGAGPTFPTTVTVGDTNVPVSIEVRNDNTPPNQGDTNTVCNAGDPAPCPAGDPGITFIPSCGQLGPFSVCNPGGADPGVFRVPAAAVGEAGTACAGRAFAITLIDPTSDTYRFTPQPPGSNVTLPGAGSVCRINFTVDVIKVPKIDQNPGMPGVQTVQVVDNTQRFGNITASGRGTSVGTTVERAQPTIATTASGNVNVAGRLTDTAVVSGRVNPQQGATIDFRLYGPDDATCAGAPVFQSLGVPYPVAGGPVTSAPYTAAAPGVYRWRATYSGDANNAPVAGACNDPNESVTVAPRAQPTIATTTSANVPLGGQLTDTAVVSGRVSPVAGAAIDFRLYGPNDATCAGAPVFESLGVPYPVAGGPVTSAPFTPAALGIYRWRATYSGDVNNESVAGACNDPNENSTVGQAAPAITTTASGTVAVGAGQLTDTAVVTGRSNPLPSTIDFRLYGPNDDICAGLPIFESLGVPYPVSGGPVTSAAYTPTAPGVYRWRATYTGDANNAAVAGDCNAPNENVVVMPTPLTLPVGELPATS